MATITETANVVYRDLASPGSPLEHKPPKPGIRSLFSMIDAALSTVGLTGGITVTYETEAELAADLAHDADTLALVYNDPDPGLIGYYVKVGASGAGSWSQTPLALPGNFAAMVSDLATALTEMQNRLASGDAGSYFAQTAVPGGAYMTLDNLSKQPVTPLSVSNGDTYQIQYSGTGYTATVDGDAIVFVATTTALQNVAVAYPRALEVGKIYEFTGTIEVAGDSFNREALAFNFLSALPVAGAADAATPTNSGMFLIRKDGVVNFSPRTGTGTYPGITMDAGVTAPALPVGSPIRLILEPLTATSARIQGYIGQAALFPGTGRVASGLPQDYYLGIGGNLFTTGDTLRFEAVNVYSKSADLPVRLWLDDTADADGDGSQAYPFNTLEQVQSVISTDGNRRVVEITGAGWFRGASLTFNAANWSEVHIRAAKGRRFALWGSRQIDIGDGDWVSLGSNLYKRPNMMGDVLGAGGNNGGFLETTPGVVQAYGRTGLQSSTGTAIYGAHIRNRTAGILNGEFSVQASGLHAGDIIIRTWDDGHPNTKQWEQTVVAAVVSVKGADPANNVACKFAMCGVELFGGYNFDLDVQRCDIDISNCRFLPTIAGSCMEISDCDGIIWGCDIGPSFADGLHATDTNSTDDLRRIPRIRIEYCRFLGSFDKADLAYAVSGGVDLVGWAGDLGSNHQINNWDFFRCVMWGGGKDAVASPGGVTVTDCDIRDCKNAAVTVSPYANTSVTASIYGGIMDGNNRSVWINNIAADVTAHIDIVGTIIKDSVASDVEVNTTNPGDFDADSFVIDCWDVKTITTGAAPTSGRTPSNAGTINVYTPVPLVHS